MKLKDGLMPGVGIKRWICQIILGVFLISYSIIELIRRWGEGISIKIFLVAILVLGCVLTYISLEKYTKKVIDIIKFEALNFSMGKKNFDDDFLFETA